MNKTRRHRRLTYITRRITVGITLIGVVAIIPALIGFKQDEPVTEKYELPVAEPIEQDPIEQDPIFPDIPMKEWTENTLLPVDSEQILVGAMTFVNLTDGVILLDKKGTERVYPASTTKLMTALLAYEKAAIAGELDQNVIVIRQTTLDIPWDSHIAHLEIGDRLTVRQALYATLLESGNDSANSLAEYVSGTTAEFAELMNERAVVLGLDGTNFKNAHGYSDPEHYTTARDMAKITYAFGTYPELVEIAGTYEFEAKFQDKDGLPKRRWWYHLGSAINSRSINYSELVQATKTGYTDESGYTMVFLMEHSGKQYALVTMQARSGQTFPTMRLVEELAFDLHSD